MSWWRGWRASAKPATASWARGARAPQLHWPGIGPEENLIHGRFIYVDDLVNAETSVAAGSEHCCSMPSRQRGAGSAATGWLLDTALDNVRAHRFYYRQGLLARALRFSQPIPPA